MGIPYHVYSMYVLNSWAVLAALQDNFLEQLSQVPAMTEGILIH